MSLHAAIYGEGSRGTASALACDAKGCGEPGEAVYTKSLGRLRVCPGHRRNLSDAGELADGPPSLARIITEEVSCRPPVAAGSSVAPAASRPSAPGAARSGSAVAAPPSLSGSTSEQVSEPQPVVAEGSAAPDASPSVDGEVEKAHRSFASTAPSSTSPGDALAGALAEAPVEAPEASTDAPSSADARSDVGDGTSPAVVATAADEPGMEGAATPDVVARGAAERRGPPSPPLERPVRDLVLRPDADSNPGLCRIAGCSKDPKYRGLCSQHYKYLTKRHIADKYALPASSGPARTAAIAAARSVAPVPPSPIPLAILGQLGLLDGATVEQVVAAIAALQDRETSLLNGLRVELRLRDDATADSACAIVASSPNLSDALYAAKTYYAAAAAGKIPNAIRRALELGDDATMAHAEVAITTIKDRDRDYRDLLSSFRHALRLDDDTRANDAVIEARKRWHDAVVGREVAGLLLGVSQQITVAPEGDLRPAMDVLRDLVADNSEAEIQSREALCRILGVATDSSHRALETAARELATVLGVSGSIVAGLTHLSNILADARIPRPKCACLDGQCQSLHLASRIHQLADERDSFQARVREIRAMLVNRAGGGTGPHAGSFYKDTSDGDAQLVDTFYRIVERVASSRGRQLGRAMPQAMTDDEVIARHDALMAARNLAPLIDAERIDVTYSTSTGLVEAATVRALEVCQQLLLRRALHGVYEEPPEPPAPAPIKLRNVPTETV